MSKHYFLGAAAGFYRKERLTHTFTIGTKKDSLKLCEYLAKEYHSNLDHVALTKNGRSALAIALKATVPKNSEVVLNGLTCYAVIEAVREAKLVPVFADVDKETLHFNVETLEKVLKKHPNVKAIITQNTFGIPIEITKIEKLAKKYDFKIIEDLAHSAGTYYEDGRKVGDVGIATAFSFGKEKAIDTISGGAVVLRDTTLPKIKAPSVSPKFSDVFRARFYPLFGAIYRTLSYVHLNGVWMRILLRLRLVERSGDNELDLDRRPPHFEAKLALAKFKDLKNHPIRDFMLVENRDLVLKLLHEHGYYFEGFWYDTPIIPLRYYKKAHYKEEECPVAVEITKKIINFPRYYSRKDLKEAYNIAKEFEK